MLKGPPLSLYSCCSLVLLGVFLCLLGSCTVLSYFNAEAIERQRDALEYQNPGNTVRVIDDNPSDVSISPGGQYMYRHYQSVSGNTLVNEGGVLENMTTGDITTFQTSGVYAWVTESLFEGPGDCLYDAANPRVCVMRVLERDENGNHYTIEFVLQNSNQIFVAAREYQLYGLAKNARGEPIAYRARYERGWGEELNLVAPDDTPITVWPHPYIGDLDFSPDSQYCATFEQGADCLILHNSRTGTETTRTCRENFFPAFKLIPLGWNAESDGYYFQVDFAGRGYTCGDVFLLIVPQ